MPESDHEKEIRRQQTELERSMREEGPSPIPDDPKPENGPGSVFRRVQQPESDMPEPSTSINVVPGAGRDGLEDASEKELLRELIQVVRNIPQEMNNLMRQE